jgi:tRNA G37 N-methylase TrmD
MALRRTLVRRPDLIDRNALSEEDRAVLDEILEDTDEPDEPQ